MSFHRDIAIFDSTLRDGAQAGISFSVQDKLNIVTALDKLESNISRQGIWL